ncbi:hypothetical protein ALC60_08118 [Trachymyrmex zeteki]|uniref:Uncharacterized protein n=1 Tax=Mycetomoellerius zeteki TaxID=64791 RepID=A0A151WXW1_9HYME|nr:hypothetical protein ALC60_08118 [Trachymyrmex zeteki]
MGLADGIVREFRSEIISSLVPPSNPPVARNGNKRSNGAYVRHEEYEDSTLIGIRRSPLRAARTDNDGHNTSVCRVSSHRTRKRYGIGHKTHPIPVGVASRETWLTPRDFGDNDVIANDVMQLERCSRSLSKPDFSPSSNSVGWWNASFFVVIWCARRGKTDSLRSHATATVVRISAGCTCHRHPSVQEGKEGGQAGGMVVPGGLPG